MEPNNRPKITVSNIIPTAGTAGAVHLLSTAQTFQKLPLTSSSSSFPQSNVLKPPHQVQVQTGGSVTPTVPLTATNNIPLAVAKLPPTPPPPAAATDAITITDPFIIEFFKNSPFEPTKFIKLCIETYNKNGKFGAVDIPEEDEEMAGDTTTGEQNRIYPNLNRLVYDCNELINYKETLKNILKHQHRENLRNIDTIKCNYLEKYLTANKITVKPTSFLCDICKTCQYASKKALSAHTRSCSKKQPFIDAMEKWDEEGDTNE